MLFLVQFDLRLSDLTFSAATVEVEVFELFFKSLLLRQYDELEGKSAIFDTILYVMFGKAID